MKARFYVLALALMTPASLTFSPFVDKISAFADETPLPPPPVFYISGIDVNGHPFTQQSSNNVLDANLGKNNFWRQMAFRMEGNQNDLRIVYWCTAADTQGTPLSEGPFTRDRFCPDVPNQSRSLGVQRVRFALSGTNAPHYRINYECWIGCANQPVQNPGGQHAANEWCGVIPPNPAIGCWVQRIAITIRGE